jgi:hypothetical protein
MPFDALPTKHVREIAILDDMEQLLANPRHWTKNALRRTRFFGIAPPSRCILGALFEADGLVNGKLSDAGGAVVLQINRMLAAKPMKDRYGIVRHNMVGFNNASTTTHEDILHLITLTKDSFL